MWARAKATTTKSLWLAAHQELSHPFVFWGRGNDLGAGATDNPPLPFSDTRANSRLTDMTQNGSVCVYTHISLSTQLGVNAGLAKVSAKRSSALSRALSETLK